MNKKLIGLGMLAVDICATAALYSRLPAQVPVHWGLSGEADAYGSRWQSILLGPGALLLCFLLMLLVERIDPLYSRPLDLDAPPAERGAFAVLMLSLMTLGTIAHVGLLLSLAGVVAIDPRLSGLFMPALLCVIGNFLPRVRPNYFSGLRTPWTLASAKVWRRAHRLAGRLLFSGGFLCALWVLTGWKRATIVFLVVLAIGFGIPAICSYFWWRDEQKAD